MIKKGVAVLLILLAIYWSFSALLPTKISNLDAPENTFSTQRALVQLKNISRQEHYVGSEAHQDVRDYIIAELEKLGLETQIQEAYSISKWGNLAKAKNILARIDGNTDGKALMLLTHYDSNPHSSLGASDAGSGVVTILEGLRAYLSENKTPKNDIIILISDGEELGLNGADIFVNKHEWANDVGLVLNFESRGSGGPSFMLIETNQGNANLMKEFVKANPQFPVANSLAYSIYKMLPNDTDLTRFREDGDIDGFNFAFIGDHFDYHTALDTYERLDRKTLEHQGSYIMPLLQHFSEANLNNIKSDLDYIYFTAPFVKTVIYPFSWISPMLFISILVFIILIVYGLKKKSIEPKQIGLGFVACFASLILSGLVGFFGWKLLNLAYPHYAEMLHGFTYNGYTYIWMFTFLALGISFGIYSKVFKPKNTASLMVAPLFVWIILCTLFAFKLQGASFFVIPVFFGLLSLFVLLRQEKPNIILMALLAFPLLMMISPFVKIFPVGLGLGILMVSTIFVVLIFGLSISVFGFFKHKKRWSYMFFLASLYFLISAHFNSKFTQENPKPNSLVYILDADTDTATWASYDVMLDDWTKVVLGDNPNDAADLNKNIITSKYKSGFSYSTQAPLKDIPEPKIEISNDTIIGDERHFEICVTGQRKVNRIDVFSKANNVYKKFRVNGVDISIDSVSGNAFNEREKNRLFSYHVADDEPLDLIINVPKDQKTTLQIYESSYDLLSNTLFNVPDRAVNMIPKPFILNDAVIVMKTILIN